MSFLSYKSIVIEKLKAYFGVLMLDELERYSESVDFEKHLKLDYEYDLNNQELIYASQIEACTGATALALWTMY